MGVGGDHPKHGVLWAGPKFARFLPGEGLSGKAGCGAVGGLSSAPGRRGHILQPLGPLLGRTRRTSLQCPQQANV